MPSQEKSLHCKVTKYSQFSIYVTSTCAWIAFRQLNHLATYVACLILWSDTSLVNPSCITVQCGSALYLLQTACHSTDPIGKWKTLKYGDPKFGNRSMETDVPQWEKATYRYLVPYWLTNVPCRQMVTVTKQSVSQAMTHQIPASTEQKLHPKWKEKK